MFLVVTYDGGEAIIKNPSEKLTFQAQSVLSKPDGYMWVKPGTNCESVVISRSRYAGATAELFIAVHSISAVRLAVPTSQGNGK